jgi:Tol biopolymer transport system component
VFTDPSGREHVVASGWTAGIAVSPRGDRIAYETYAPSSVTLHVARTDGRGEIAAIGGASSAAWSPAGQRLAFTYGRAIAVAGADGRAVRRIARGVRLRAPAWSPDGRRIAYVRDDRALETAAPDGKHRTRVARARVLIDFWWSPKSRRIYYDAVTAGSGRPRG